MWRYLLLLYCLFLAMNSAYANKMAVPMDIRIDITAETSNVVRVQLFVQQMARVNALHVLLFSPSMATKISGVDSWQGTLHALNVWQKILDVRYQLNQNLALQGMWKGYVSGDIGGLQVSKTGEQGLNVMRQSGKIRVHAGMREALSKPSVIR